MPEYDLLIRNGAVVDGTGNPWFRADVAIAGGSIAAMGSIAPSKADKIIDAKGKFVAPGFIDIHTHSDLTLMRYPRAESANMQGVTTHCTGNCGFSPAPVKDEHLEDIQRNWGRVGGDVGWHWRSFGEYLDGLQGKGLGINVAPLLGHHALRLATMGYEEGAPGKEELEEMRALAAASMEDGAFGMSTGLVYPPGCFAGTEEVVEICRVVATHGGIYTSHIRGERETIVEALHIAEAAGLPLQISHNCPKYGAWGKLKETLPLIEAARARGIDVTLDNDVHTDLGPSLHHALPQWMEALGVEGIVETLGDRGKREEVKREIVEDRLPAFGPTGLLKHGRFERITIYNAPDRELIGRTVEEVARARGRDPFDTYLDLIVEGRGKVWAIFDYISEEDIVTLLRHPLVMICSDGAAKGPPGEGEEAMAFISFAYGPCDYGEFPGVLERYVRERPVLRLEEAVRKMTSFPAQKLGLADRGVLRPGMAADITVFDLARVKDRATNPWPHTYPFENFPHRFPDGIDHVMVNGIPVVLDGRPTGALPGRVLRHRSTAT